MSVFAAACLAAGLPEPLPEHRFAPPRKWQFDWAWPRQGIALEVEGGLYGMGKKCPWCGQRKRKGHTSVDRYRRDLAKYNAAAVLGWRILRCLPEDFKTGRVLAVLSRAFARDTR